MSSEEKVHTRGPVHDLLRQVEEAHRDPGDQLCCVHCHTAVTTSNQKTTVQSTHNFHLTNSDGDEFDIACFSEAWGCGMHGRPSDEHSWFSGFRWQFAHCLNCESHLGWYFDEQKKEGDDRVHFFGLLIDKLVPADFYDD